MKRKRAIFGIVLVIVLFAFVSNGMAETYEEKYSRCAKECYPPFIDCYSNICTGYDEDECRACRLKCHEVHEKCFTICMDEVITTMDLTVTTDKKTYSPGDVVLISGKVFNASGGIGNAKVDIELGKIGMFTSTLIAQVDTNSNGDYNYNFPLPLGFDHAEYAITVIAKVPEYEDVIAMGDFTVGEVPLRIEDNPVTGKPYVGVVADGVSYLNVSISLPECSRLKFTTPVIGRLEGDYIDPVTNEIMLSIVDGSAELKYYPPKYLTSSQLTQSLDVHYLGSPIWAAEVPLTFTYKDVDSVECTMEAKILVCRPQIMMVHGFLGSTATWAYMANELQKEKFDTYLGDYRVAGLGIGGLSYVLEKYIKEQNDDYASANIKVAKVDIIAHSMGGLISRFYVHNTYGYSGDVRKLIMVATPNHGTLWVKMQAGKAASKWCQMHQKPALQLYSESSFMKELNKGEEFGTHLNYDVQYGNIYGWPDDHIVSAASAYLNGVTDEVVYVVKHSVAIPSIPDLGITVSSKTQEKVKSWLINDIGVAPLRNAYAEVSSYKGDVYLMFPDLRPYFHFKPDMKLDDTPIWITSYHTLRTEKDSKATISMLLGDSMWGFIYLDENSEMSLGHCSPKLVEVCLYKGSARFSSEQDTHFTVPVQITKSASGEWWKCRPKAVVTGLDTEFVITANDEIEVRCLKGMLTVDTEGRTTLSEDESMTVKVEPPKEDDPENLTVEVEPDTTACMTFKVPPTGKWASESWFNTCLNVTSGQTISITATGSLQPSTGRDLLCGPNGTFEVDYWVTSFSFLTDCGSGALIARIGVAGDPFFIGTNTSFIAPTDGELWLGINDIDPGNDLGGFVAEVCTGKETPAQSTGCNWTGTWQTNWGEMVLSQTGNQVNGTYTHDAGRITGTVLGSVLTGTWSEAPSYSPSGDAGDVQFTISEDCSSFAGIWRYGSSGDWSENWDGTRIVVSPPNVEMQRLSPVADGWVYAYSYRNWNWANKGIYVSMCAGWHPLGGESRTYLRFDIPSNVDINRAVLKLYQYHSPGSVPDLSVYRVTSSWDEGTDTYHSGTVEETAAPGELCWMQQPSFDPVSVASLVSATTVPSWVEVDITSMVQQWQSGTPNYGLLIKTSNKNPTSNDPVSVAGYNTKEHLDQETHPFLELSVMP